MGTNRPILLVLAAGLGSRYGKMKQIEEVGPNRESILEYSIYDAVKAGFKRIVFVINREVEVFFNKEILPRRWENIDLSYVTQKSDQLPDGFKTPKERAKPWGTGHAVLAAREKIDQPFAVVNADDFYGGGAYKTMVEALSSMSPLSADFCMLGYILKNTLSGKGYVSRGLCEQEDGFLTSISELSHIKKEGDKIFSFTKEGKRPVNPDSLVSMNFWGFSPKVFQILEGCFRVFLKDNLNCSAEYFITEPLNYAIKNSLIKVKVHPTSEKWLGVTYLEDKPAVVEGIKRCIRQGLYPDKLR